MNVLFIHPIFPGPFFQLAEYLGENKENTVIFLTREHDLSVPDGIKLVTYKNPTPIPTNVHSIGKIPAKAAMEGLSVAKALQELCGKSGFRPDIVIGFVGQGAVLYVKDVLPKVPLIGFFDWFYKPLGEEELEDLCRIRTANTPLLTSLHSCDICCTPTYWQKAQFPNMYQSYIRVIPEGVDTDFFRPNIKVKLVLPSIGLDLSGCKEVVTYVSKGLEPYRGFPAFMDSIRILLKRRPKCHVVIGGRDKAYYGAPYTSDGKTWKQAEIEKGGYDEKRVHFIGRVSKGEYRLLLQTSTVYVYLTHANTILSYSCSEALGAGCCVVGADVPPVRELIIDGENGLLADIDNPEDIADKIETALRDKTLRNSLKKNARAMILNRYSLRKCTERQIGTIEEVKRRGVSAY